MKSHLAPVAGLLLLTLRLAAAPDPTWLSHDRERPLPPVVDPGTGSTPERPGRPPADAIILFDGKDLSAWSALDGSPTQWVAKDGALECAPGSGYIRSFQAFGDCQLHVEWAAPATVKGDSQGRGNSGVFFGLNRYEIQVLDSRNNRTYADGSAASIYGQYPPLVNVTRGPGDWQMYDIIWTAPRFDPAGNLASPARMTVLHNGVLVQNNVELAGPTGWIGPIPYQAHALRQPIALQDHGNPVRYRNIWIRELDGHRLPEYRLADALLDTYIGNYGPPGQWNKSKVKRGPDGLLLFTLAGSELVMHAASPTHFYALTTDVQVIFDLANEKPRLLVTVGDDFSRAMVLEKAP